LAFLKNPWSVLGILTLLILVTVSAAACSSESTASQTTTTTATSTTTATQTTAPANTQASATSTTSTPAAASPAAGGALSDILGRAAGIPSMKYDIITTVKGVPTTAKMWAKNKSLRMEATEQGQNIVMLVNGDTNTVYMYSPAENTAFKMDFGQAPESASDSSSILKYNPTVVGTETLDGKVCEVIQYDENGVTTKTWIWQEKGLPVRVEANTAEGNSITDFKNYDFSDIPDSQFELSAGVKITNFGLPTDLPTNLPSGIPTDFPTGG
jgi:outer membrane lipoprotein-sorting protein